MKDVHFAELMPEKGKVAISGGQLEEDLLKAVAYAHTMGKDLRIVPLTPKQMRLCYELDIPHVSGVPTYFFLQAEHRGDGFLLESETSSVFVDRIMSKMAEHVIALVVDTRKEFLVEVVPYFLEYTLDELSLYGEPKEVGRNHFGHVLVELPLSDDPFSLLHIIRDVPGVIDAGIYLTPPEKTIDVIR